MLRNFGQLRCLLKSKNIKEGMEEGKNFQIPPSAMYEFFFLVLTQIHSNRGEQILPSAIYLLPNLEY